MNTPSLEGFAAYLADRHGKATCLTHGQEKMAKILVELVRYEAADADVSAFLVARGTGKTFLFENFCDYLNQFRV